MNAEDFRIGNLVKSPKGEICKIAKIDNEESNFIIRAWQIKNEMWGTTEPKPIKLTADWFGKLGIHEQVTPNGMSYTEIGRLRIYYPTDAIKCSLSFVVDSGWCPETGITIKYVHQLQNLYHALTGDDLEAEPARILK